MDELKYTFLLGAATAAHQVEGNNFNSDAWVEENLPNSSYDEPSLDAVDHYHKYEEDIKMLAESGCNAYRFSIEWARIEPECGRWDEKEIEHYRKVLLCCKENQLVPIVTLFHFTSPKWLIEQGGWERPQVVIYFARYCRKVAEELGYLMEYVCTMNEANMRLQIKEILEGLGKKCGQAPQIGMNLKQKDADRELAEAFGLTYPELPATFVSPCTPKGDEIVMQAHKAARDAVKKACPSVQVGLTLTVHDIQALPGGEYFAEEEWDKEFLHYLPCLVEDDFLGVQCYTRKRFDCNGLIENERDMATTQMGYEDYPAAIGNVLRKIAQSYHGIMIVTENGIATENDDRRIAFMEEAVRGVADCRKEGIPVKGYMYWSLFDNFEWQKGYSMTFGLIEVDRKTQRRFPKKSLSYLGSLLKQKRFNS